MTHDDVADASARLSRRAMMGAGAAAAFAALTPGLAVAQADRMGRLLALSAQLLEKPAAALDAQMGKALLAVIETRGLAASLDRLAAAPAQTDPLAQAIVSCWYCGLFTLNGEAVLVGYADALMWSAMSFTKPLGLCGGEFGYWAEAPV